MAQVFYLETKMHENGNNEEGFRSAHQHVKNIEDYLGNCPVKETAVAISTTVTTNKSRKFSRSTLPYYYLVRDSRLHIYLIY